MMSDEEKQELRKQVISELRKRLSDDDIEQIKSKQETEMERCIVCDQQRFNELLVQTEGDTIGCAFCLQIQDKRTKNESEV